MIMILNPFYEESCEAWLMRVFIFKTYNARCFLMKTTGLWDIYLFKKIEKIWYLDKELMRPEFNLTENQLNEFLEVLNIEYP